MADVDGLAKVVANLNREVAGIEGRTLKGMVRGAIVVIRGTEKVPPLTPLDTGNLRASRFVVTSKGGTPMGNTPTFVDSESVSAGRLIADHTSALTKATGDARSKRGPTVVLGYTAYYAPIVHEMMGARFQRPGAGAKWLEASLRRNRPKILESIREEAKV